MNSNKYLSKKMLLFIENYELIFEDWINEVITDYEIGLIDKYADIRSELLDIGGGYGRHIKKLDRYNVTIVDKNTNACNYLQTHYGSKQIVCKDIYEFVNYTSNRFIIATMFFNTFCEVATNYSEGKKIIEQIFNKTLHKEGYLILGITDTNTVERKLNKPYKMIKSNDQYIFELYYNLVDFDQVEQVATTKDKIKIICTTTGKILYNHESLNKKKWWTEQDLIRIASECSLKLQINYFEDNIYFILRK